jgi:hypothetical protein
MVCNVPLQLHSVPGRCGAGPTGRMNARVISRKGVSCSWRRTAANVPDNDYCLLPDLGGGGFPLQIHHEAPRGAQARRTAPSLIRVRPALGSVTCAQLGISTTKPAFRNDGEPKVYLIMIGIYGLTLGFGEGTSQSAARRASATNRIRSNPHPTSPLLPS